MFISYFLFLFVFLIPKTFAETQCVKATGWAVCPFNHRDERFLQVQLLDDDTVSETLMGETRTDSKGYFEVDGCADDWFGDPDPFIRVFSKCGTASIHQTDTTVRYTFKPLINDFGLIFVDKVGVISTEGDTGAAAGTPRNHGGDD